MQGSHPAAKSSRLPDGVVVQPRRFEFRDLQSVPQHWFAGNPIVTHIENAFSVLIPPGERFFIRSVRHYEHRADPELADLIRGFLQQEAQHTWKRRPPTRIASSRGCRRPSRTRCSWA
jgi:predicted metal-dependent hydrolase